MIKSNKTITNVISNLPNPIHANSSDALLGIKRIHNNTAAKTVGTEISVSLFIRINSYKPIEASAYTKTVKGTPPYITMGMNSAAATTPVIILLFHYQTLSFYTPPNLRPLRRKSVIAFSKCSSLKSGQYTSVNQNSEYCNLP